MALRLAFMGTPTFSVPTLRALHAAGHDIAAVYTRAPAASGRRGKNLGPSPVHAAAGALGIEVRTPGSLRTEGEREAFRALGCDAAVVVAYGRILPPAILDAVPMGCWNAHASLLPRWRGAAPIQRAVMAGDAETGVQVMRMEEGLDTGPVALTHREPIGPTTTAGDLFATLAERGAELMVEAMARLEAGTLETEEQDPGGATYADKIDKDEARIDWSRPARRVAAHVNGMSPFPGAWTTLGGGRVKLLRADLPLDDVPMLPDEDGASFPAVAADDLPHIVVTGAGAMPATTVPDPEEVIDAPTSPGDVLVADDLRVACADGTALRVLEVQRAGGRPLSGAEFARALPDGARFE